MSDFEEEKFGPLVKLLGYPLDAKLLIINADDAGMCHSMNLGIREVFLFGLVKSTTVMVPCPWFLNFVKMYHNTPAMNAGVHLCLTSEWQAYRWGPVAPKDEVSSLLDKEGYLPHDIEEVYDRAKVEEVAIEFEAQIKRAFDFGIKVTHVDAHMGIFHFNEEYFQIALALAQKYRVTMREAYYPRKVFLRNRGWAIPDLLIFDTHDVPLEKREEFYFAQIRKNLQPGMVVELVIHAAVATSELSAITDSALCRDFDRQLFSSEKMRQFLKEQGIITIGYSDLQRLTAKNLGWG